MTVDLPLTGDRFAPLLDRVREGAVARERDHHLLHSEVRELAAQGFGAARLPVSEGGEGLGLVEVLERVIAVSAADSNLGHVWRGHIGFVESLALDGWHTPSARRWLPRIARGDVVGNAQSEKRELSDLGTELTRTADGLRLTGTKYYTTGSIYADWIHLAALDAGERVAVTVDARQPAVRVIDDWDGFGQPLTGSGTTTFSDAVVDPADIAASADSPVRWQYVGAVFQLTLLAVIAGITQRAHEDTVDYVRARRRTFGFAGERVPAEDPLVQEVVGEVGAAVSSTRRLVLSIARDLDAAREDYQGGDERAFDTLTFEVYRAQRTVADLALTATTRLFEVGGASAVSREKALDRHWRNIRTIATHNPVAQRIRAVGDFELTGRSPEWAAPAAPTTTSTPLSGQ